MLYLGTNVRINLNLSDKFHSLTKMLSLSWIDNKNRYNASPSRTSVDNLRTIKNCMKIEEE